jgi:hypothetical protein
MKKVLLVSVAALLALGCATAANVHRTAVALHHDGAVVQAPMQAAAVRQAALREPADAPIRVASADRGAPDATIGAARLHGGEGRAMAPAMARGSAPSNGYGGASKNPDATACGGVDNNPEGAPPLFIPELKPENGGSAEKDDSGRTVRPDGKVKEALTPAAAVEGNNPIEGGGTLFVPSNDGRNGKRDGAKSGRAAGKIPEALSPMDARANNNPMDDSAAALRLPPDTGVSRSADRFGSDRTGTTRALGERARPQNRANGILQRRDDRSDNNPLD